jgi:hypothetical protein
VIDTYQNRNCCVMSVERLLMPFSAPQLPASPKPKSASPSKPMRLHCRKPTCALLCAAVPALTSRECWHPNALHVQPC